MREGQAKEGPGDEGDCIAGSSVSLRFGGSVVRALAVGALEASIEHPRAHLALVLALEQRAAAAFVAPAIVGLIGRAVEDHAIALDAVDVRAAQRMMASAAFRIGPGEDQAVARDLVDGSDMAVVIADDLHMLAHLAEHAALVHPPLAPAAEVAFEARLVLAAIVVIVAVELAHMALAPRLVMRVLVARPVGPVRCPGAARAAIFVAAPGRLRARILAHLPLAAAIVAGHRPIAALAIP